MGSRPSDRLGAVAFCLIISVCTLAGCASGIGSPVNADSAVGTVSAAMRRGPALTVGVGNGCPRSLGGAVDVKNDIAGRHDTLLPVGEGPRAGLVCEYGPGPGAGSTRRRHAVELDTEDAQRLSASIARISLAPATGSVSCPVQFLGAETIIAFSYAEHRTVDLWYSTSGCRTLDNGDVLAFQGGNPSFYDGFQSTLASVAPGN